MTTTFAGAGYGHAETLAAAARETIAAATPADYLAALGATPGEVAATLRALGITGVQTVADSCPVATYLRDHAGQGWAAVSTHSIAFDRWPTIGTPPAVAAFVRAFDRGDYPDLIAPAEPGAGE